jgi:hypothetical protein
MTDYLEKFRAYFGSQVSDAPTSKIPCPWHDDKDPSLSLNIQTGQYHCFGCSKAGNVDDLVGNYTIIDEVTVEKFHQELLAEPRLIEWLEKTKGVLLSTITTLKLGHNGSRFTFPVRDEFGKCVNLRLYSPSSQPKILHYGEGYGSPAFFPFPPQEAEILLMEGETDTMIARQLGLPAYTQTGGAGSWHPVLTKQVNGRRVSIVYDTDRAGRAGVRKLVNLIKFAVPDLRNIILPVGAPHKDFSDWVLKENGTPEALKEIIANTPPYAVSKVDVAIDNPTKMLLAEAFRATWAYKAIQAAVIVAGKDRAPYLIPKRVLAECSADKKFCGACPNASGAKEYSVDWKDGQLLLFVDAPDAIKATMMRQLFDLVTGCKGARFVVKEFQNVEKLALLPNRNWYDVTDLQGSDNTCRKAYFIGSGVQSNTAYEIKAIPIPDPKDQSCALLVIEADPIHAADEEVDLSLCEMFREDAAHGKDQAKAGEL